MKSDSPVVLVTGATGKLGRQFAMGFAELGASIAFTSRGGESASALEASCRAAGAARVACVTGDLSDEDAPERIAQELERLDLMPSVLVNNARDVKNLAIGADGRTAREHWRGELDLGVIFPYELTMTLAARAGSPLNSVINVASIYGVTAPNLRLYNRPELESPVQYGVTKAALIHLTKELAVRLADRRIRVNAVSYGGVRGRVSDDFLSRYGQLCPSGTMLEDGDVFGAVQFLASPGSSAMTGHNLVVDGGWTAW